MSAPIVVGFDPRAPDEAPVRFGLAAARFTGAPVIVVAVGPDGSALDRHASGELDDAPSTDEQAALERARALVEAEPDVSGDVRVVEGHSAARGLHRAIDDEGAALVVVGATSAGSAGRALVGSTAERVIHGSPCAVAVVPHGFEGAGLHSIGVAYSRVARGRGGAKTAAGLAARAGAKLRVITVLREEAGTLASPRRGERAAEVLPEEIAAHHNLSARAALGDALAGAGDVEAETELVYGDPAEALLGFTATLDLLVMGSRAYGPRRAVMLGGVSRRVTAAARCPVIVLPRGAERSLGDLLS